MMISTRIYLSSGLQAADPGKMTGALRDIQNALSDLEPRIKPFLGNRISLPQSQVSSSRRLLQWPVKQPFGAPRLNITHSKPTFMQRSACIAWANSQTGTISFVNLHKVGSRLPSGTLSLERCRRQMSCRRTMRVREACAARQKQQQLFQRLMRSCKSIWGATLSCWKPSRRRSFTRSQSLHS